MLDAEGQTVIRSTSSSVISSPVRSYSFVVRGISCAMSCAFSSVRPKTMAADTGLQPGRAASPLNHIPGVEIRFEIMMRRHVVALAAFFMQAHPPALALRSNPQRACRARR